MEEKKSQIEGVESKGEQVDDSKRNVVAALLGSLGVAALAGCTNQVSSGASEDSEPIKRVAEAITGTQQLRWVSWIGTNPTNEDLPSNLRDLDGPTHGEIAIAEGFWEPGDGGGGVFYWDENTDCVDDGGTVIVPHQVQSPTHARTGACWKRIYSGALNVKWFGARGNGTDDSEAILRVFAQVNASGSVRRAVFFPSGTYGMASQKITISNCGAQIDGAGASEGGSTALFWDAAYDGVGIEVQAAAHHFQLRDICLKRPMQPSAPSSETSIAVLLYDTSHSKLNNVEILSSGDTGCNGWRYGVKIECVNYAFTHKLACCRIAAHYHAVWAYHANAISMVQCNASADSSNGNSAVYLQGGSGHAIIASNIEGNATYSITVDDGGAVAEPTSGHGTVAISGNYIESNSASAFIRVKQYSKPVRGVSISGNFFSTCSGGVPVGVSLAGCQGVTISGNNFVNLTYSGIYAEVGSVNMNLDIAANAHTSTTSSYMPVYLGDNPASAYSGRVDYPSQSASWTYGRATGHMIKTADVNSASPAIAGATIMKTANTVVTTITSISGMNEGHVLILIPGDSVTTILRGGDWNLSADWHSSTGKALTITKCGTTYYELGRG